MLLHRESATRAPSCCPRCSSQTLREGQGAMTIMQTVAFTDDQGRHHLHDSNVTTTALTCMACNFAFVAREYRTCWCGWSGAPPSSSVLEGVVEDRVAGCNDDDTGVWCELVTENGFSGPLFDTLIRLIGQRVRITIEPITAG